MIHKALLLFSFIFHADVLAKLLVSPTHISLNNNNTAQTLQITNENNENATYKIEYMYQKMTENGSYIPATEDEKKQLQAIEQYVIYPQEEITLKPKQSKKIKFQINTKNPLPQQEYTAHILLKDITTNRQQNLQNNAQFTINAQPLFHIAIPIFVHKNAKTFKAKISNIQLNKKLHSIIFHIENIGALSPYGDISITFQNNNKVLYTETLSGVSIPNPLKKRLIEVKYSTEFNINEAQYIVITYNSSPEFSKPYPIAISKLAI
jgi:P pilus assembly chaperone PapD